MKTLIYVMLIVQFCLFAAGIYFLCQGDVFHGLFNIILNAIFIPINIDNLITFYKNEITRAKNRIEFLESRPCYSLVYCKRSRK